MSSTDNLEIAAWSINKETNVLNLSPVLRNWIGCSDDELNYSPSLLYGIVYKEDIQAFEDHMSVLLQGQPSCLEYRILLPIGEVKWIQNIGIPIRDKCNNVIRIDGTLLDLTEKRKAQQLIENKQSLLEGMLQTIDMAIWSYDHVSKRVLFISDAMRTITGYPPATFMNVNGWRDIVHSDDVALYNYQADAVSQGVPDLTEYRIIHANGEVRWIQVRIIPCLCPDNGELIVRFDGVIMDVTARKSMEEALHRSEQRYKSLFEYNSDILCELNINGDVLDINPRGKQFIEEACIGTAQDFSIMDSFGSEHRETMQYYFEKALQGYSQSYTITSSRQNGEVFHWQLKNIPIYVKHEIVGAFNVAQDVTVRNRVENELRDSEERYRRLIELSPQPIVSHYRETMLSMNPAGLHLLGATKPDTLIGKSIFDFIHTDSKEMIMNREQQLVDNQYIANIENKLIRLDGQVIETRATGIYDDKTGTILTLIEDMTATKRAEQALVESKELNHRITELSPEAIVLHSDYRFIHMNPAGLQLFGESAVSDMVGKLILDYISPEYVEMVARRLDDLYTHPKISPVVEEQIIRANGEIVDVEVVANTFTYEGKTACISMFRDISDRKRLEEERKRSEQIIRESEERYYRLQMSLDRFSQDMFGVMKFSQMEQRLLQEIQDVLKVKKARLIKVEHNKDRLCKMIETESGYSLKIGEINGASCLLSIEEKPITLEAASTRVWLETITRYVSVLFDQFLLIEDLTKELRLVSSKQVTPKWLLRFMFKLSENERKHLAQDLHDAALQEQIILYRKLDKLVTNGFFSEETQEQLTHITQGLLDVIYQIRITCNELRPPMLIKEGLVASLEVLFDFTQLRGNYRIEFDADNFDDTLNDESLLGLYRIVQELLANATKHSHATEVRIQITSHDERIRMEYIDNGIGMDLAALEDSYNSMGLYGIKERVRSMDGTVEFYSRSNKGGLAVYVSIPAHE
ncbi:MAG: PAS domain S-box protein [Candidatus Pristimantibacillus sp.]